jgi:hypothetical protein
MDDKRALLWDYFCNIDNIKYEKKKLNEQHIVIINRVICGDNYFIMMSRILLINDTFSLLRNQSFEIEYEQLSCIYNVKIWIIIY